MELIKIVSLPFFRKKQSLLVEHTAVKKPTVTEKLKTHITGVKSLFNRKFNPNYYEQNRRESDLKKYKNIYRSVPLIASAIDTMANHAIETGFDIVGDKLAKKRVEDFFEKINSSSFLLNSAKTALVFGDSFAEIEKKGRKVVGLKPINPINFFVEYDKYGRIKGYFQKVDNKKIRLKPEEVLHFKWNPIADDMYGTSFIKPLYNPLIQKLKAEENISTIFERYASPILHYKLGTFEEPATEAEMKTMQSRLEIISPDMDLVSDHRLNIEAVGTQKATLRFQDLLTHIEQQIITGVQTPEVLLYRSSDSNEAASRVKLESYERNIRVLQKIISEEIEDKLFPLLIGNLKNIPKMEWAELSSAEDVVVSQMLVSLKNSGIITPNEARQKMNYDPIPGQDELDSQTPPVNSFGSVSTNDTSRDIAGKTTPDKSKNN